MFMENDADFSNSLRAAFHENFEHARHLEIQRQQQLAVFVTLLGAVLAFIFRDYISLHSALQQYWPVFLFLAIYSFIISSSISKWNIEFKSHLKHIQWIAEKLGLIRCVSVERELAVIRSHSKEDKGTLLADSLSQGYIALALPLPRRVNRDFEYIVDIILAGTTFAFVSGLFIYTISAFYSAYTFPLFGTELPLRIIAYPLGIFFGSIVVLLNLRSRNKMKQYAAKLLDIRQPDGINLYYQGYRPFYSDQNNRDGDNNSEKIS
jgi:hypothetical protein